jgi:predicted kinase
MTGRVIVCVGLSGAGKSTWAEQYIKEHPHTVRINKDSIRAMLYAGREWTRAQEEFVCMIRDTHLCLALSEGYSVVIDDTNLDPKHIMAIQTIVGLSLVGLQDFTSVPLGTCLERNKNRKDKDPIPADVIIRMHNDYFEDGIWKYRNEFLEEKKTDG